MLLRFLILAALLACAIGTQVTLRGSKDSGTVFEKCEPSECRGMSGCLTVYQHPNHGGYCQCLLFNNTECVTLSKWWIVRTEDASRVSSVDTHGTCVRLYAGIGCTGKSLEVRHGSPNHADLRKLYFDDTMHSASSCDRPPQPFTVAANYEKCSSSACAGKKACVTVYENRNYGGWYSCVAIRDKECVTLDDWWYHSTKAKVSSVDTRGSCVRLFEGKDCSKGFIELKAGSLHHMDLRKWNWEDRTRSVGACDRESVAFGYNFFLAFAPILQPPKCTRTECSGMAGCATVYENINFRGNSKCIKFKNEECISVDGRRNGASVWSLNMGVLSIDNHNTCIRLYDGPACNGAYLEVTSSNRRIGQINGYNPKSDVQSMSSCRRPIAYNPKCYVQTLFSRNIRSDEVSQANSNILGVLDGVTEVTVSGVSMAVSILGPLHSFLKFLVDLFQSAKDDDALIGARIEKSETRNAAAEVDARIYAINDELESMLSPSTPPHDRMDALGNALHSCVQLKRLLTNDKQYDFSNNKVASSPYLVSFATLYLSVARFAYEMRNYTEARKKIINEMNGLTTLVEHFLTEGIRQRKAKFPDSNKHLSGYIEDKVVCDDIGSKHPADCAAYMYCDPMRSPCGLCLANIKRSIEIEFEKFFRPVITALKGFPKLA